MIVQRMTVTAKGNHAKDLMDLILSELVAQRERGNYSRPFRAYSPQFSGQPSNQLIFEWEYEDIAERDRVWAEWFALPTTLAYMEKWREWTEPGYIDEIWKIRTP